MWIATPAFFCFPFARNILLHPLTFSLYVSLGLKWVSCRQHTYGSCFCVHSASLCLLIGAFNLFTFKVIIDIYVPIIIFLVVGVRFCKSFLSLRFLTIQIPLPFVVKLIWWCWILWTFTCLKNFWFLHQFWMRSLPGIVILVVDFSLSVL